MLQGGRSLSQLPQSLSQSPALLTNLSLYPRFLLCRSWVRWFRKSYLAESGEPLPAADKLLVELRLRRMEPGERLAAFDQGK